jgi:hypothetical protein
MSNTDLFNILNAIKMNSAIDYQRLKTLTIKAGISPTILAKILKPEHPHQRLQTMKVLDEDRLDSLILLHSPKRKVVDRKSAEESGDSHKHRVSASYLMMDRPNLSHPVIIINDKQGYILPEDFSLGRRLIVVENQENFLNTLQTIEFVNKQCLIETTGDIDVIFGSGNGISSVWNKRFLSHYEQVYCLLDIDTGGCRIFLNLMSLLDGSKTLQLLIPNDAEQRLIRSSNRGNGQLTQKSSKELDKMYGKNKQVDSMINLIMKYDTELEQEDYLA